MADHNPVGFRKRMDGTLGCRIQVDELDPTAWENAIVRDNDELRAPLMGAVHSFEAVFDRGGTMERGAITKATWSVLHPSGATKFNVEIEVVGNSFKWTCNQENPPGATLVPHILRPTGGTGPDRIPTSIVGELVKTSGRFISVEAATGNPGPFEASLIYLRPQI